MQSVATEATEGGAAKGVRNIGKEALTELSIDDLFKLIEKGKPNLAQRISRMDKNTQRLLGKALQEDAAFLKTFMASNTLLDEYAIYAKEAPLLAKDINFLRAFAKTKEGISWKILKAKGNNNCTNFFDPATNKIVALYKNGVVTLYEPFKLGPKKMLLLKDASLLKVELIPNAVYKINGEKGLSYLFNVDNIGRCYLVKASNIWPDQIWNNIVHRNCDTYFGREWISEYKKMDKIRTGDFDISYRVSYMDDGMVPAFGHIDITYKAKPYLSKTYRNWTSADFAKIRSSSKPSYQYVDGIVYNAARKSNPNIMSDLDLNSSSDPSVLRKNMECFINRDKNAKSMNDWEAEIAEYFGVTRAEAHHVVAGNKGDADKSRIILQKCGININDPRNGIFLPQHKNSIFKGAIHGNHVPEYDHIVLGRLQAMVRQYGYSQEECVKALDGIKKDLLEGRLTLLSDKSYIR